MAQKSNLTPDMDHHLIQQPPLHLSFIKQKKSRIQHRSSLLLQLVFLGENLILFNMQGGFIYNHIEGNKKIQFYFI